MFSFSKKFIVSLIFSQIKLFFFFFPKKYCFLRFFHKLIIKLFFLLLFFKKCIVFFIFSQMKMFVLIFPTIFLFSSFFHKLNCFYSPFPKKNIFSFIFFLRKLCFSLFCLHLSFSFQAVVSALMKWTVEHLKILDSSGDYIVLSTYLPTLQ